MPRFFNGMVVGAVAVLTLTGTAYAATGGTFVLGRNNAASSQTLLTSSGAGPVLALSTRAGQVPLAVSAAAGKATNLNADRVDGVVSAPLQRRVTGACADGSAVSAIGASGSLTCVETVLANNVQDVSDPSGVVRVPCPDVGGVEGHAVSGGYALPQGVVALPTATSVYRDEAEGRQGYNARFTNLDGTPYAGTVNLNVVCSYRGLDDAAGTSSLRTSRSGVPPLR